MERRVNIAVYDALVAKYEAVTGQYYSPHSDVRYAGDVASVTTLEWVNNCQSRQVDRYRISGQAINLRRQLDAAQ